MPLGTHSHAGIGTRRRCTCLKLFLHGETTPRAKVYLQIKRVLAEFTQCSRSRTLQWSHLPTSCSCHCSGQSKKDAWFVASIMHAPPARKARLQEPGAHRPGQTVSQCVSASGSR